MTESERSRDEREGAGSGEVDSSAGRRHAQSTPGAQVCDLCGAPVQERHCKILCLTCGYQRDCSDP